MRNSSPMQICTEMLTQNRCWQILSAYYFNFLQKYVEKLIEHVWRKFCLFLFCSDEHLQKQSSGRRKSKKCVTSCELRVQIYELRIQIHRLRVQIHELRVQIYKLGD